MKLWDIRPNNIRVIKVHYQQNMTFHAMGWAVQTIIKISMPNSQQAGINYMTVLCAYTLVCVIFLFMA